MLVNHTLPADYMFAMKHFFLYTINSCTLDDDYNRRVLHQVHKYHSTLHWCIIILVIYNKNPSRKVRYIQRKSTIDNCIANKNLHHSFVRLDRFWLVKKSNINVVFLANRQ